MLIENGSGKHSAASEHIAALRDLMRERGLAACIVPTGDPHMSEYVSHHYESRAFITGFTGSAGTAVITDSDAGLWTDSRYWLQAAQELAGSGVRLFREGSSDTPSVEDWLCEQLGSARSDGELSDERPATGSGDLIMDAPIVNVPGELISAARADVLRSAFRRHGIRLATDTDPVAAIWHERPSLHLHPVADHPTEYAGASRQEKIALIRDDLAKAASGIRSCADPADPCRCAKALILTSLDDIAWLLNLRGGDIPCNPVFYSYVILTDDQIRLYADTPAGYDAGSGEPSLRFHPSLRTALAGSGICLLPYDRFYADLSLLENTIVVLDKRRCNDHILQSLPRSAEVIDTPSPVMQRKCIKNPVEMDGIRAAHIRDGVAMCRFLCWLKQRITESAAHPLTELSIAAKLYGFRSEQDLFRGNSFDPIVAYGPHGAIVHYSATEESDAVPQPRGLLLIDSGGQYLDGTTDITRTIVLGPITDEEKRCFTAVLRGHIALARAVFPAGCSGATLDAYARQPLWAKGLDFGHGTGHGVGAFLNVHEDPVRISWNNRTAPAFAEGMLVSDEPGYYAAGAFGIRHENLLLCVCGDGFLRFETVTLVPFDLDGIDPAQMQPDEISWLNAYHQRVFEVISPHLNDDERAWLKDATRSI